MLGFIVFNDQNSLAFIEGNESLKKHLLILQQDFLPDISSGFSELPTTPDCSRDEEEFVQSSTEVSSDFLTRKSSSKSDSSNYNSTLDYNALTQIFLPIVILWRTKSEFDRDPYIEFCAFNSIRFSFRNLRDNYLLVGLSDSKVEPKWKSDRYLESVCSILEFCFGSLLSILSSNSSSNDSRTYKRLLNKFLTQLSWEIPRGQQSLQWMSKGVDIGAFLDSSQGAMVQTLAILGREFQVYLGSSITLLISNQTLLAAQQTVIDFDAVEYHKSDKKVTVLTAKDTLHLIKLCPIFSDSKKSPSKPRHIQVWLEEPAGMIKPWKSDNPLVLRRREVSQRFPWDIFRFEIIPGTHLLCLGRSLGSDIVARISFVLDILDSIENEVTDVESLLRLLDKCMSYICHNLVDMIPDESGAGSGALLQNLHRTSTGLKHQWERLKQNFEIALNEAKKHSTLYPGETKPQPISQRQNFFLNSAYSAYSAGIDAQISAMSSQLRSLMFQLVQKSQESAKSYKLEMFEKCWTRLNASKLYQAQTKNLLSVIRSNEFRSLNPADLSLDMIGYLFLCPRKRVTFTFIPLKLERELQFGQTVSHILSIRNFCRSEVFLPKNDILDYYMIQIGNLSQFPEYNSEASNQKSVSKPGDDKDFGSKSRSDGKSTKKSGKLETFLNKFRKLAIDATSLNDLEESVWCLAIFESFTHPELAISQTEKLSMALLQRTNVISWNFG